MPKEYAEDKIREALKIHSGNTALARKQIMLWSHDDSSLLRALSSPHLDGIIAYQIERVASGRAEIEKRHPNEANNQPEKEVNFGIDLLRAVASREATIFGHDSPVTQKRKTASKQHIDAIHKMASASRHIKKKNK